MRSLAIDAGNTHLSWGVFEESDLVEVGKLSNEAAWDLPLPAWGAPDAVGVISVNAESTRRLRSVPCDWINTSPGSRRMVHFGPEVPIPVKVAVPHREQVGLDRLANALAWRSRADTPAIIVDFGTAITFDLISRRGIYIGGLILPGPELISRSLASGTSLLPEVAIAPTPEVFGRETETALRRGVFGLLRGGVEFHLRALRDESPEDCVVVATGGGAPTFAPWFDGVEVIVPYLTLDGVRVALESWLSEAQEVSTNGVV